MILEAYRYAPGNQTKFETEIHRIDRGINRSQEQTTNLVDNKVRFTYLDARRSGLFEFTYFWPLIDSNTQLTFLDNLPGK